MTDHTFETSPQLYARIGGVLYLIIIVVGLFGEAFVRDRLMYRAMQPPQRPTSCRTNRCGVSISLPNCSC